MSVLDSILGKSGSGVTKINGVLKSSLSGIGAVTIQNSPSLPAFSNVLAAYGLNNFNPVGYPAGKAFETQADAKLFSATTPYRIDYVALENGGDLPPYTVNLWADQNSNANDLVDNNNQPQDPILQVTTPVIVSGAGTSAANGTYTYRGQSGGKAYYNLVGQSTSTVDSAIVWVAGEVAWKLTSAAGGDGTLYQSNDDVSFPWQATFVENAGDSPSPTVAAGTQTGEIQFDGSSDCLATAGSLTLGTAATAYLRFKTTDIASTDILFEIGATPTATPFALSVRTVAGVLTVTVTDGTGLLFNTKTCNVSSNTWYIITVIIDTTLSAANQVKLLVNNSTSGVSAPVSTDLASGNLADGRLFVAARNQASSFLAGSMTDLYIESVADDSTRATAMYTYINAL